MTNSTPKIEPFFYWMNERHRIYLKRHVQKEPWPWTEDKILREYRFCNLFRELDTTTIWIKENIRKPYEYHENLWFALCLARQINWQGTLADIFKLTRFPYEWNPAEVRDVMLERQRHGEKVYTGAYMLSGAGAAGHDKPYYTLYKVLDPVFQDMVSSSSTPGLPDVHPLTNSIQSAVEWLSKFQGWGGFLAYEVATDLRHTRYLEHAHDIMTWANPGPGAKRGLNRIFGRQLEASVPGKQMLEEMQWLLSLCEKYLQDHILDSNIMEMRDIEHSLCEMDKYLRVKHGEGKPRQKFHSF